MTDRRYHAKFKDNDSGEELGLILLETPQVGLTRRLINPYAAKTGQGDRQYSDLTEWTVVAQDDWRGGRGQDRFEEDTAFYDSQGLETRIEGQFTLGPYSHAPAADIPINEGSEEGATWFGYGAVEQMADEGAPGITLNDDQAAAQRIDPDRVYVLRDDSQARIASVDVMLMKQSGFADGSTITCAIYNSQTYSNGDVVPYQSLGSATLTGADLSTSYTWETFTFSTPVDVSGYATWWIVLSHNDTGEDLVWRVGPLADLYPRGYPALKNAAGADWDAVETDHDFTFKMHWANIKVAQQFTTGSGFNLSSISLWGSHWGKKVKVSLYSDSGTDTPDTELRTAVLGRFDNIEAGANCTTTTIYAEDIDDLSGGSMWVEINDETRMVGDVFPDYEDPYFTVTSAFSSAPAEGDIIRTGYWQSKTTGWKKARFDSVYALAATTKYWIVVEHVEEGEGTPFNGWSSVGHGGSYADGICLQKLGSMAWSSLSRDLLFRLNDFALDGDVVAFARYDGAWYCGAGDTVYKWEESTQQWGASDTLSGDNVTDLAVWGSYLWAARGGDYVLRKYNGTSWADVTGRNGNLLYGGGGYLHYSGTGANSHIVYYTANGTDWDALGECGAGDYSVRGMAWYRDTLFAATDVALWNLSVEDWAYPVLDWSAQEDEYNGRGLTAWNKTNCLYIPLRYGLYRWNGDSMVAVGPEQGTGLPEERAGHIVDMAATTNWLYVAIDAGDGNISSVLCYNGMGGWHEIGRNEDARKRIRAVGFSTLDTPSRLWYGLGDETRYCELPDRSDNPFQWRAFTFNPSGLLITSWFGTDLIEVVKDLHEIVVRGEGMDDTHRADIYVQVDHAKYGGSPLWTYWGTADQSPRTSLGWDYTPPWSRKKIGADSTRTKIMLDSEYSGLGMLPGDFVRINGEISQVQRGYPTYVKLAAALDAAPESGDWIYASRPAGRIFRVMVQLHSSEVGDHAKETPKIDSLLVRYQNNVLDQFLWTVKVNCGDDLKDLGGADYPMTSADLRTELDSWARRTTAFTLVDMDGREHLVKITSAGEGGYTREERAGGQVYASTYNFNLVEVG